MTDPPPDLSAQGGDDRSLCELARTLRLSALPRFGNDPDAVVLAQARGQVGLRAEAVQPDPAVPLFRVTSGFFASEGRLGVTNAGMNEVLIFGPDGSLVTRMGRPGAGPDEFRQLHFSRLDADGETVVAYDMSAGAVKEFTLDGEFVRSERMQTTALSYDAFRIADGFITQQQPARIGTQVRGEVMEGYVSILYVSADGRSVREIANMPGQEMIVFEVPGRGTTAISLIPFGTRPWIIVDPSGCVVHPGEREPEITFLTPEGELVLKAVLPFVDVNIDSRTWAAALERVGSDFPDLPNPGRRPAWSRGLWDGAALVWLEDHHDVRDPTTGWWVIDMRTGTAVFVAAPEGADRLVAVTPERAALVFQDELGVESVRTFEIVPSS